MTVIHMMDVDGSTHGQARLAAVSVPSEVFLPFLLPLGTPNIVDISLCWFHK